MCENKHRDLIFSCDRCGTDVHQDEAVVNDGRLYHRDCYEKLLEKKEI